MKSLILASQSEGRRELLKERGYVFEISQSHFNEESIRDADPRELVKKLSLAKARAVLHKFTSPTVILAGDQVVRIGRDIVGKPKDAAQLRKWLNHLSDSSAECIQGYAIIDTKTGNEWVGVDSARAYFKKIPQEEVEQWIATGKPFSRAGGFSISCRWFTRFEGERSTIIGMPMHIVGPILDKLLDKV